MRSCPQCATNVDGTHNFCPSCGFPIGKIAKDSDDPLIGRTLPGGYVILELVGVGGMGRVYRAEQSALGRTVAVKIIHPHLVGEENAAARFITEARAASRLNHPNSVSIIDFGKTPDGQLYLVMEYLRGKDLARVSYEEGPLPIRRIVEIGKQVLAALSEAHHLDIIHRDLKPENIILEPVRSGGDFVKVVDFGLAKMRAENQAPSITSPGIVCGTPEYMSPEQGRGDPLDARSDLYAVGVILFQMLTGRLPFEAESPTQVVLAHLTEPAPDPRKVAPERAIPDPIADVVLKSLAKEQDGRFNNADEFAAAIAVAAQPDDRTSLRGDTLVRCLGCGALNATTQKFCGECGKALSVQPLPSPAREVSIRVKDPASARISTPPASVPRFGQATGEPRNLLPFLGRERDIGWLDARRSEARANLVGARLVGDSGIGKTRLLREFLLLSAAGGDLVVETGPDPNYAEVGYYALRRAMVALAGLPESGGNVRDWGGADETARRGLAEVFGIEITGLTLDSTSPEERREAAAEALRWAIRRGGERANGHRVIVAIDDLHLVDGASRNAFADLLGEPSGPPALLVSAYTPGFDPGWSAGAASARVLTGLSGAHVTSALAGSPLASTLPLLAEARSVSPLFLEQLLAFAREQGGNAPARVADIIALRVERLPSDARRVLQAIAVWGDDATDAILMQLLPEDTDLVEALGYLRRASVIRVYEQTFATCHPLVRDVVLATIPAAVRRALHTKAATIAEASDAPLEVRAMHEYHAHSSFQALILLDRLSNVCSDRGDSAGAVLALRRGLELARRELFRGELDDPVRAVLIFSRRLGETLARTGAFTDAEGILREALDLAGPSGDDRARVLGVLAHVAHGRDRQEEAAGYLGEALTLAQKSGAHELVKSLEELRRAMAS